MTTSIVVLDSSIILATFLGETYSEQARNLIARWHQNNVRLAAPMLFKYEITAVLRKQTHRGNITLNQAQQALSDILAIHIEYFVDDVLLKRAFDIATHFSRPTAYDSQYVALAERLGCEFWTADEKLFNTLKAELLWVKWLGGFST